MPTAKILNNKGVRLPSVTTVLGAYKDPTPLMIWAAREVVASAIEQIETRITWNNVTEAQIMEIVESAGWAWKEKKKRAASAGTLGHELVDLEVHGEEVPFDWGDSFDEELVDRAHTALENFRHWRSETGLVIRATEVTLVDDAAGFGGTLDIVGDVDQHLTLLDLKTSNAVYLEHARQCGAYAHLWENGRLNKLQATNRRFDTEKMGLGEKIEAIRILRISKDGAEWEDFRIDRPDVERLMGGFLALKSVYDLDKKIKRSTGVGKRYD